MNTMPTYHDVLNGATAADFIIPESEVELADKVALAVQDDIDDAKDAMDANIMAEGIIKDFEDITRLIPDGVRDSMKEAFIHGVCQDKISTVEATNNLDSALIEHDENAKVEAWDDYDMRMI